jgi:hypothetical protein
MVDELAGFDILGIEEFEEGTLPEALPGHPAEKRRKLTGERPKSGKETPLPADIRKLPAWFPKTARGGPGNRLTGQRDNGHE